MPTLKRTTDGAKLETLLGLFLQAETDIVNEIGRLRSRGLTDYHAEAALERVQAILRKLENDCWKYVPQMVERQFYVHHPEARKTLEFPETAEKHRRGYLNAYVLTGEQTDIVNRLVMNLMGEVVEGDLTVYATLERALLGRRENDRFRLAGLSQTALAQAKGQGLFRAVPGFVEALRREGVTAFIDRGGRRWSLHTYGSMVLRTTSRQAEVLSVLTRDPEQDLYKISRHGTTCKLCAPLEGRVYSKSGADPDFPPLSAALGEPFWNIHPNCLHQLTPWTPMGRSPEEIRNIKEFSSLQKNPVTRDPRTQSQIEAYRTKERDRAKWLADYRQWENYRTALGDRAPKTFQTFLRHKRAGDETYQAWKTGFREARQLEKYSRVRYHGDGTVVVTDDWTNKDRPKLNKQYRPNAVVDTLSQDGRQHDRTIYDSSGIIKLQIHGGAHGNPKLHPFGKHGEHVHDYTWPEQGRPDRPAREATEAERIQHRDILGGFEHDS